MCDAVDFRSNLLTFLPQVLYVDFESVDEEERRSALEQNPSTTELKEDDVARSLADTNAKDSRQRSERLHAANLDNVAGLVDAMFTDDEDGTRLCSFSYIADLQTQHKEALHTIVMEALQKLQDSKDTNMEEEKAIKAALQVVCTKSDDVAREALRVTQKRLKKIKNLMSSEEANVSELTTMLSAFASDADKLKLDLMTEEMALNEQCMALVGDFELAYADMQTKRLDLFNRFFRAAEKAEGEFKEKITLYVSCGCWWQRRVCRSSMWC